MLYRTSHRAAANLLCKPAPVSVRITWISGRGGCAMALNTDKIDDAAMALLYLTLHGGHRAWKGFDFDVLGRLYDKGMTDNPVGKTKSVSFTPEGLARARALFETMFKQ